MVYLFALIPLTDTGMKTGLGWNDHKEADVRATPFAQYARYVLKGNFTLPASRGSNSRWIRPHRQSGGSVAY
ncbi:MAG: hypothetical protein ABIM19_00530 [candidate division WOR-3 bacterium]